MSGMCEPCANGTFKEFKTDEFCTACPYGYTTATTGATSAAQCDIGMYLQTIYWYLFLYK